MCNRNVSDDHDFLFLLSVRPKNIDRIKTPGITDIFLIDFLIFTKILCATELFMMYMFFLQFRPGKIDKENQ